MDTKTLRELNIEVIGGQILKRIEIEDESEEEANDKGRKTVVAKTIGYGEIKDDCIVEKNYKTIVDQAKYTKKGDVLIKLSAPYNAVYIDENNENMLVSSFCAILRGLHHVNPHYLVACLNSEYCQQQLTQSVAGSIIGILNNLKIASLKIPYIDLNEQEKIGNKFNKVIKNRKIIEKILYLEEEKINAIIENLED